MLIGRVPHVVSPDLGLPGKGGFAIARRLPARDSHEVSLTNDEFELPAAFVQHAGHVLSRDFLLLATHRREAAPFHRTIDVQAGHRLRKLEDAAGEPRIIKTVRAVGGLFLPTVELG